MRTYPADTSMNKIITKNIKDIRRKGRKGVCESIMIGYWYITELV